MKAYSAEESLWLTLPILLVLLGLVAALAAFQNQGGEIRSKASESPSATVITPTENSEVVCSSTYEPVCGSDKQTYLNTCEANQKKIFSYTTGACPSPADLPTVKE